MNENLTDITLVMDRSGSMEARRKDAEGGVNAFIQEQAQEPEEAVLTLVQFDTKYELIHSGVPIGEVPPYTLRPRGATALLDAVGRAILETGTRLEAMPEAERPGLVIFVINTDGLENSSHEFTRDRIREMIRHQQEVYNWQFTYLGANQDAFEEGMQLGIRQAGIADYSMEKVGESFGATSSKVSRMRHQRRSQQPVCNEFTQEERKDMT